MTTLHFNAFYGHDDKRDKRVCIVAAHVVSVHTNDSKRVVVTLASGNYFTLDEQHSYDSVLDQLNI